MYILCDINAAYVAFCQLFNPQFDMHKTPLGVLSSNQGNIIARNEPMKSLGIKMGAPVFEALPSIEKGNGHLWGSNFQLFADLSSRFHCELQSIAMDHTPYSVDEAFCQTNLASTNELKEHATSIQSTLKQNLGLMCGIGIGPTKTIAKLGSHCAKSVRWREKTGGIGVLDTTDKINWALERTNVNDIWNVGAKTTYKLNELGVMNGLQLKNFNITKAKKLFSVTVCRTIQELNNINAIELNDLDASRARICVSRSMGKYVHNINELRAALSAHATTASYKLRRFKLFTSHISIFIHTDSFREDHNQHHQSIQVALPQHTSDTDIILRYALFALNSIYKEGYKYKKVGIILDRFLSESDIQQLDLFKSTDTLTISKRSQIYDDINDKFGTGTLRFASQGFKTDWQPKNNLAPPSYTTNIADIPLANAK